MKKALITGITGQDGSYLAELLLEKGYEVHGIIRRSSVSTTSRIDHIINKIKLHDGDLSDSSSIIRIVAEVSRMKYTILLPKAMFRCPLTLRNIPATSTRLVCCGFWKQYICSVWTSPAAYIRHHH